ncbi:hypothetical protein C476_07911 [Natrinema limicola JCM 13563]|uniref:Uncharacterized protein n=1 Tax=Natrinema limicola JCM 13563 TaxID=1230457 RepID=M0CEE2_9EURY|nr:hypothetical protein C476_07911 [Natrinema limicola JCM 13563]
MPPETIGSNSESGFSSADVLAEAQQDDEIVDDPKVCQTVYVSVRDESDIDLLEVELVTDPNPAYATAHDVELKRRGDEWVQHEIDDLALCKLEHNPEWLPSEYDRDADLRERLPLMTEVDVQIELVAQDDAFRPEPVGTPRSISETDYDVLVVETSHTTGQTDFEIVAPQPGNTDPYVKRINHDAEAEDYKETIFEPVDVRIYNYDDNRLADHAEVPT